MDIVNYNEIRKLKLNIGDLNNLHTEEKDDIVTALNEVLQKSVGGGLVEISTDITNVMTNEVRKLYISFPHICYIKGIRVTGNENTGIFSFKVLTKENGHYVYYSDYVENVLWDIMEDNPFIDETGEDKAYIELENKGVTSDFHIQIYTFIL